MIYTNLFKTNKASQTKTAVYYMVESRRYKFNIIFDKKFTSILSSMALGAFMIASINVGIYVITTSNNARIISSLEAENNNHESSLTQLESQMTAYNNQKTNADNIYNISDKPTKWSSIIDSIAEQLPYDTVLTSVTTTRGDIDSNNVEGSTGTNNNSTNNTDNNVDNNSNGDNVQNDNTNSSPTLDEQLSANEDIVDNNVIAITGKSLSMVNLSLFLDKLDKLDIFSKVECFNAEREADSSYYGFVIYAFLN